MRMTRRGRAGRDRDGVRRGHLIGRGGRPASRAAAWREPGAAAHGALLAKCGGATLAVGAGDIGTSIAVCTLPAFTVMVFTLTGLIGSPEPGFGWRDSEDATGGAAWIAGATWAGLVSPSATLFGRHRCHRVGSRETADRRACGTVGLRLRRRRDDLGALGDLGDRALRRAARDVLLDQHAHARIARRARGAAEHHRHDVAVAAPHRGDEVEAARRACSRS